MIFLILKILAYLIIAAAIGFGLGWGLRHIQARKDQDADHRKVHDAKSKIPHLESQMRGRNDQISKLKATIQDHKQAASELKLEMEGIRQEAREAQIESRKYKAQKDAITGTHELAEDGVLDFGGSDTQDEYNKPSRSDQKWLLRIAELEAEVQALRETQGTENFSEKKWRLETQGDDYQTLKDLLDERDTKITALERERELQQRTLTMLHQQLETERQRQQKRA
jgi:flagellar biosynthesis chaperone FliJ